MGSCRGMSSSHHRPRYVSWCVDSPPPMTTTETSGQTDAPEPHMTFTQPHQTQSQSHPSTASTTHNTDNVNSGIDEGEDDDSRTTEDNSTQLLRSSSITSRCHRPISWHGGGNDVFAPSSLDSPTPASGSGCLNQAGQWTASSMEDLGFKPSSSRKLSLVQEDNEPCCVSVSSDLNQILNAGFHLPFSEQQGLTEEHKDQSSDVQHTSGLSTSTPHSKERRSSGIPEISTEVFKTTCELEKENSHFIVVDMVLGVLECAKWTLNFERWTSAMDSQQDTCCRMCTHTFTGSVGKLKQRRKACRRSTVEAKQDNTMRHSVGDNGTPLINTPSIKSYAPWYNESKEEEEEGKHEHQPKTFSVLSTDSGFEDCGVDTMLTQRDSLTNAEWLAQQLVLEFKKSWLPSKVPLRGRQSLRSSLQELPGTGDVAESSESLKEEIRLRTRMRGSLCWAPPRFQIIFTVQPTHRRSEVVASQHFLCAGCGTAVEARYIKKLRYCDYLGRFFCDCCHSSSEAVIPGRVLSNWDFGRYPVSDFSKQLLESVWNQPLFDLTCVGKTLYNKVKELDKFREVQEQLLGIKKLLKTCRLSERLMKEFEQLPCHLTEQPHLFSMDDLYRAKKSQLVAPAKAVLRSALEHVETCELCLARGFICEFCKEKNIIFPFQRDICKRCQVCKACFHKMCFVEKKCPKCARIQSRKKTF